MVGADMPALGEIAAIYRASKKKQDINWWTEWVCRPVAAALVYGLRNTRITPNQLTFLSLVICAVSAVMLFVDNGYGWVVAAIAVFEISFVLDCADGQLARLRKRASVLGHLLDFLMDEIKAFLVYGAVVLHLWRFSGSDSYLAIGIVGLVGLASGIACTSFMRRPEYGAPPPTKDGQPAVIKRRRGGLGMLVTGLEHAARIVVHYPSYIWLLAVVGRLDIYFWAYTVVNILYAGRCVAQMAYRLGRFAPIERTSSPEAGTPDRATAEQRATDPAREVE